MASTDEQEAGRRTRPAALRLAEHPSVVAVRAAYLVAMRTIGTWGDSLCVYALEEEFAVRVEVYHLDGQNRVHQANFPARVADEGHTVRLVTPPTGQVGVYNHFDPLLRDPPVEDAVPLLVEAPDVLGPAAPWQYWNDKALCLYEPPFAHSMFREAWRPRRGLARFALFISNSNGHVIDRATPGVVITSLDSAATKLSSRLMRAAHFADERATPDSAVEEPFTMTLVADKDTGLATEVIDAAPVTITLWIQRYEQVREVHLRLEARTGKKFEPLKVTLARKDLDKHKGDAAPVALSSDGKVTVTAQKVTLPLAAVFTAKQLQTVDWVQSPYRLLASANGEIDDGATEPAAWSWTYLHVPNAWNVNITPRVADARLLLLEDDLAGLSAVAGVRVVARSDDTDDIVDLPRNVRDRTNFITGQKAPGQLQSCIDALTGKGYTGYDPNISNVMWELDDGTWDVATSWASVAVLQHDAQAGVYHLTSILTLGKRDLLRITCKSREDAGPLIGSALRQLKTYKEALEHLKRVLANPSLPGEMAVRAREKVQEIYDGLKGDMPTVLALGGLTELPKIAPAAEAVERLRLVTEAHSRILVQCAERKAPFNKAVNYDRSGELEGAKDFHYARNKERKFEAWNQYFFPRGIVVNKAVTRGISSCAGGVTFACDKDGPPSVIILWHIDAGPSVPVKALIHQLWPDLERCPDLRTLAYVFPDQGEPNKYRDSMMYPAAIRDRCKTVFLSRGPHLGVSTFNVGSGSDYFGVVAAKGVMDLCFTHDILKRTDMIGKRRDANTDGEVAVTLKSFHRSVFGTYKYRAIAVGASDLGAMRRYMAKVAANDDEVKADKFASCHMCRLPAIGLGLFNAVDACARPMGQLACFVLGQKLELEFANTSIEDVLDSRWRPGSVEG